jgi:hypothetical protein
MGKEYKRASRINDQIKERINRKRKTVSSQRKPPEM